MNTLLKIQVKILAKEAQAVLRQLNTQLGSLGRTSGAGSANATKGLNNALRMTSAEVNKINRGLLELSGRGTFTQLGRDADRFKTKLGEINARLGDIGSGSTGQTWQLTPNAPASRWNSGRGAQEAARAAAAAEKAAANESKAALRGIALQSKMSARERAQAAKSAAAEEVAATKAAAEQTKASMRGIAMQVRMLNREKVAAAKAAADAERKAEQEARAALKSREAFLRSVSRVNERIAKETARKIAQAEREAEKQRRDDIKRTQQAFVEAKRQEAAAARMAAVGADPSNLTFLGRLSNQVNGEVNRTRLGMIQMGKDLQWVGRQINFNFTIPLAFAGGQALGWALDVERAFVRVKKVYGDGTKSAAEYAEELEKVQEGVRLMSDYFGIAQEEVMSLAADWAAAGLEGGNLLQAVQNSIELASLGDYTNATETFDDLITIMAAYKLSVEEVGEAVALLNTVENETATTLPGLVKGLARAGGAANAAGVDIRHLAAMMAVLTPATGSAETAGNALKTILSRVMAPTQDTIEILDALGLQYDETFSKMTGEQRLEAMASAWMQLDEAGKSLVGTVAAGRYQFSRFGVLMEDIGSQTGTYAKVLESIDPANLGKNLQQANDELQAILGSNPKRVEILTTMFKNLLVDAIMPLIPFLIGLLSAVTQLFQWFSQLDPIVMKITIGFLGLVMAVGIITQAVGSVQLLFGTFAKFIIWLLTLLPGVGLTAAASAGAVGTAATAASGAIATQAALASGAVSTAAAATTGVVATAATTNVGIVATATTAQAGILARFVAFLRTIGVAIVAALTSPWTLVVAAVAGLALIFREQVVDAVMWAVRRVQEGFNLLPRSIQNALSAVARVIAGAIGVIRDLLSYLNPFQRHSPSLVDNVKAGVAVIAAEYAKLTSIGNPIAKIAADMEEFNRVTADAIALAKQQGRDEERMFVAKHSPGSLPALNQMYGNVDTITAAMQGLNPIIAAQQAKVDQLAEAYDIASAKVDDFDASLDPLRERVTDLGNELDAAKTRLSEFGNTPIRGMKAMSDAIFDNEMAQKRLRLEMLKMEEAGQTYEQVMDKIGLINGDIETLRAQMTNLREAGAGSDVLAVYEDQIAALEAQKDGLKVAAGNSRELENQLEALQRQGEILDLENSLQFDPLRRQIEDLMNTTEELSFDEIVSGIISQQDEVARLTDEYERNKTALDGQEEILKTLKTERDALKDTYDAEKAVLQGMQEEYKKYEDQLRAVEEAIAAVVEASRALEQAQASTGGGGGGGGGAGGVGPLDMTGAENITGLLDETQLDIDAWLEDFRGRMEGIFDFNLIDSVKAAWERFVQWWNSTVVPGFQTLVRYLFDNPQILAVAAAAFFGGLPGAILGVLVALNWDTIRDFIGNLFADFDIDFPFSDIFTDTFNEIADSIGPFVEDAGRALGEFFDELGEALGKFSELSGPAIQAAGNIWGAIQRLLDLLRIVFAPAIMGIGVVFRAAWESMQRIIGPIWDLISNTVIGGINMIRNIISLVLSLINGDWGAAWEALRGIMDGFWTWTTDVLTTALEVVVGIIAGTAQALWEAGQAMMEGLWNGLTEAVANVLTFFMELPGKIIDGFKRLFGINSPSTVFMQIGVNILTGLLNGLVSFVGSVLSFFGGLPGRILTAVGNVIATLFQKGVDFVTGIVNGITNKVIEVTAFFVNLPGDIVRWVGSVTRTLWEKGRDILDGLQNGIINKWNDVRSWVTDLPGKIVTAIGNVGRTLLGVGREIMDSLWGGLKEKWEDVKRWLGNVTDWIPDWKGPPSKDATLLVENGRLVMQGFADGLSTGMKDVKNQLKSFTNDIPKTITVGQKPLSAGTASTTNNESKTFIFNGDLSFPNVTKSTDVDRFLINLEALAEPSRS